MIRNIGLERKERLNIEHFKTKYCKPKTAQCSCSRLFDGLLQNEQFEDVVHLHLLMSPSKKDYIAACRCYLGASARAGFDSVEITHATERCNGKNSISVGEYANLCENVLAPKACGGYWDITKVRFSKLCDIR